MKTGTGLFFKNKELKSNNDNAQKSDEKYNKKFVEEEYSKNFISTNTSHKNKFHSQQEDYSPIYYESNNNLHQAYKSEYKKSDFWLKKVETEIIYPVNKPHRNWQYTELGHSFKNNNIKNKLKKRDQDSIKIINSDSDSNFCFKVATYNILAPDLVDQNRYLYKNIKSNFLDWEYRKKKIYNQIKYLNCDIYCFQEMQLNSFNDYFNPKLNKLGYECYFKKRYGNEKLDGCCICFKSKKFELVKQVDVDYFVPGVELLNRENVALILLLKPKAKNKIDEDKRLCVATTHVLYNPKRGDCKLAQLQILMANLDRIAYKKSIILNNKIHPIYHPTILCGDFNCSNNSKLYEFINNSKLDNYKNLNKILLSGQQESTEKYSPIGNCLLPERLGVSDQSQFKQETEKRFIEALFLNNKSLDKCDIKIECTFGNENLSHKFNFNSAYNHYNESGSLEITTMVEGCKKTVDYIFYHSGDENFNEAFENDFNKLKEDNTVSLKRFRDTISIQNMSHKNINNLCLIARLELFTSNFLEDFSLPNKDYPSDHFLLAAKFVMT